MPEELLASTTGWRALVAGMLLFALLWWTVERILGDSDDPSFVLGGDWVLFRASGLPLIALTAVGIGLLLAPEIMASNAGVLAVLPLAAVVMIWWGYKTEEREGG